MSTPNTSAPTRRRQRRRSVAASQIEHLYASGDPEALDERFSALPHARRDPCEIAFFPERFVRIYGAPLLFRHGWAPLKNR